MRTGLELIYTHRWLTTTTPTSTAGESCELDAIDTEASSASVGAPRRSRRPTPLARLDLFATDDSLHQSADGAGGGRHHRPVVRTQSSRLSLLRHLSSSQSPAGASDGEPSFDQHFALPDK